MKTKVRSNKEITRYYIESKIFKIDPIKIHSVHIEKNILAISIETFKDSINKSFLNDTTEKIKDFCKRNHIIISLLPDKDLFKYNYTSDLNFIINY